MRTFGLIGYPLSHSFSKKYFSEKFRDSGISDCEYELFPLAEIKDLPQLISQQPNLAGLNVTIPYKIEVIPFLDSLDQAAEAIGAVNCIKFEQVAGKKLLKGFNTDVYGFKLSLAPLLSGESVKALVFGDGGAAQAVKYALSELGIAYTLVTRKPQANSISYADVDEACMAAHLLLINTTPLGMSPDVDAAPLIPYEHVTAQHVAYDLVYNPQITKFLMQAEARGAVIKNGLEMLTLQAERAWEIWNK